MAMADDIAAMTKHAELDQLLAGMTSIARASIQFYGDLIREGFTKAQAFEMTKQWQHIVFSSAITQNK